MNAQEQSETPSVVLCQQYQTELTDALADFAHANSLVADMREAATRLGSVGLIDAADSIRLGALMINALLEFVPIGQIPGVSDGRIA